MTRKNFFLFLTLLLPLSSTASSWFVRGDFLYWKAQEDGLEYFAYRPIADTTGPFSYLSPRFRWDPGLRLGVGYQDFCSSLFTSLTWTHLKSHAKSSFHYNGPPNLGGVRRIFFSSGNNFSLPIVNAESNWKSDYNVIDWVFGNSFSGCSWVNFIPFAGVRGAWIDQSVVNNLAVGVATPNLTVNEKITNDYHAGGLRAGFSLSTDFWCGFGLFAETSASLLYGNFHVKVIQTGTLLPLAGSNERLHRVRSNLETNLGIQWSAHFGCSQVLTFRAAYELVYWPEQNQIPAQLEPDFTKSSDLSFQGLTLSGIYSF